MIVDHERAWLRLKAVIVAKRAHGQKDLLAEMARIEVECEVNEPGFDPTPHTPVDSGPAPIQPARVRGRALVRDGTH